MAEVVGVAEVPVVAVAVPDLALVSAVLRCQELLNLSLRFVPLPETELRRDIHAALAIRPNG